MRFNRTCSVRALLFGIIVAITACGARGADEGQKWALLVGIDRYQVPEVTPLRFAVADVRSVAETLIKVAGFPSDHVFLLTSDQPAESIPTRPNIAFRLSWLAERVKPTDSVVFFFSGHGMVERGIDGQMVSYLLTSESDPRKMETLEWSALKTADVKSLLKRLKSRHLLVCFDACRNDPRAGRGSGENPMTAGLARDLAVTGRPQEVGVLDPVWATMYACNTGQRSYEWNEKGHGFFTYRLVEGLRGAAADQQGHVTLGSLNDYLESQVPRDTERTLGVQQVPLTKSEGTGVNKWVLATVKPSTRSGRPSTTSSVSGTSVDLDTWVHQSVPSPSLADHWAGVEVDDELEIVHSGDFRIEVKQAEKDGGSVGKPKNWSPFTVWSIWPGNHPLHLTGMLPKDIKYPVYLVLHASGTANDKTGQNETYLYLTVNGTVIYGKRDKLFNREFKEHKDQEVITLIDAQGRGLGGMARGEPFDIAIGASRAGGTRICIHGIRVRSSSGRY